MSNPGNLSLFISKAMSYCWDESHGYSQEYDGMGNPGFDCSGFVGRCLYEAGFMYPSYHVGTINMKPALQLAGFSIIPVTTVLQYPKDGDIVVMNHLDLTGGHTFIYAENVYGYTSTMSGDSDSYPDTTGTVAYAKIEASTYRSWHDYNTNADNPNSAGACTQVWVHAFSSLYGGYDPTDPNDEIYFARWPGGLKRLELWQMKKIIERNRKII